MNSRRVLGSVVAVGLALLLTASMMAGVGLAAEEECESATDATLCIDDLSVSENELLVGDEAEFTVTITNHGEETATGVLLLYTAGPDNETDAYQMDRVTLDTGESESFTQAINASTPGAHGLRIALVDPTTGEQYDTSEIRTVEVREEAPAELGGPIDKTEIALVALVASILGMVGLGYREYNR